MNEDGSADLEDEFRRCKFVSVRCAERCAGELLRREVCERSSRRQIGRQGITAIGRLNRIHIPVTVEQKVELFALSLDNSVLRYQDTSVREVRFILELKLAETGTVWLALKSAKHPERS
jgi:hypothetical protein